MCWHIQIFISQIWDEHNIKIILQHFKNSVGNKDPRVKKFNQIQKKLDDVQLWMEGTLSDSGSLDPSDHHEHHSCHNHANNRCPCCKRMIKKNKARKSVRQKCSTDKKSYKVKGVKLHEASVDDLVDFINNGLGKGKQKGKMGPEGA